MMKIFRKTRQSLLSENRFSKYLVYATGEIVLVVIGILIAVSINNWNEDRKQVILKDSYKISLMNDLSLDTLMLGKMINANYSALNYLGAQQKRFLGPEAPIDTLVLILKGEFDPELNTRFKYNRNTVNTLISSGKIDIFSKDLNELILSLMSLQDLERENANYYAEIYSTKLSRFSGDYPVSGHQNSNLMNMIWTDVDARKLASGFISLTDIKGFAHYSFIREMKNVKEQTANVLSHMAKGEYEK